MTLPDRRSETDPDMKMATTYRSCMVHQGGRQPRSMVGSPAITYFSLCFGAHYQLSICLPSRSNHRDSDGITLVDVGVPWFLSSKK